MTEEDQTQLEPQDAAPVDPPADPIPAPVKEWTDEDEKEARAFGWKPPEKWVGEKPDGLIEDPRQFLQGNRGFRILRERTEKLEADFAERVKRLEAVTAKVAERDRAAHTAKLAEIEAQKLDAVSNADRERYDALERQRQAMPEPVAFDVPEAKAEVPPRHPEVEEYAKANDWVNNPILAEAGRVAIERGGYLGRPVREQLEFAERAVKQAYPGAFQPAPQVATHKPQVLRVDGGGLGGGGRTGQWDKVPPEAKAAFARFVTQGIFKDTPADREAYANDYHS